MQPQAATYLEDRRREKSTKDLSGRTGILFTLCEAHQSRNGLRSPTRAGKVSAQAHYCPWRALAYDQPGKASGARMYAPGLPPSCVHELRGTWLQAAVALRVRAKTTGAFGRTHCFLRAADRPQCRDFVNLNYLLTG